MTRAALDAVPFTAADLGFAGDDASGWTKTLRGTPVAFRPIRALAEFDPVERLQQVVFGVSDRDLAAASGLIVVQETGGEILGAYVPDGGDLTLAGVLVGWGGWVDRRPRILSDLLAVEPRFRNLGLGGELKKLQAAVALSRGFKEIVWTVDPLRAANARLNFEKLGAVSDVYERDRYGAEYGAGLYGGMPTDRLHVRWEIGSDHVRDRLLGGAPARDRDAVASLPAWRPGLRAHAARIAIPDDVDALLAADPDAARRWRLDTRAQIEGAFADGWHVTGFAPGTGPDRSASSLLLERPHDAGDAGS